MMYDSTKKEVNPLIARYVSHHDNALEFQCFLKNMKAGENELNDINYHGKLSGYTPLMTSVIQDDVTIINLLLDKGVDINAQKNDGETALMCAITNENINATDLLLKRGADVDKRDQDGCSPLHFNHVNGHHDGVFKISESLIKYGADVNSRTDYGSTPLMCASSYTDNTNIIKLLIEYGGKINLRDNAGETALFEPCRFGCEENVIALLDGGIDIDTQNNCGETPLMAACFEEREGIVKILLAHNADVHLKNSDGDRAVDILYKDSIKTIEMLRSHRKVPKTLKNGCIITVRANIRLVRRGKRIWGRKAFNTLMTKNSGKDERSRVFGRGLKRGMTK
jgi:ankyrin repeat protein